MKHIKVNQLYVAEGWIMRDIQCNGSVKFECRFVIYPKDATEFSDKNAERLMCIIEMLAPRDNIEIIEVTKG